MESADIPRRRLGKTRFVGFTGHKDTCLHMRMLELHDFDASQMPLNVIDTHFRSFEKIVLPAFVANDVGVIGMKSFGDNRILKSGVVSPQEALSYVLSLPVSVVVSSMQNERDLQQNLQIVPCFEPLSSAEIERILAKTASSNISGDGRYELYKTTEQFDADIGRVAHGFPTMSESSF